MIVKNDLFDYQNRYIYQDSDFFKFSVDSILLSEFANKYPLNGKILVICTGNAVVPLILSKYTSNIIYCFEIQKSIAKLAQLSIEENKLTNQIKLINDDIKNIGNYYPKNYFNIITCNPPYFEYNGQMVNKTKEKLIARHEVTLNLEQIFEIASNYLENNGIMYIINRSERLDEIINLGFKYKICVKEIQLIKTKEKTNPSLVIAKCIKNSKKHIRINDVICIQNYNSYKNIFKEEEK